MTPHLLQEEVFRSHRNFYSWKEAFRHLLSAPRERLYNAKIRIMGSLLALWIRCQVRGHRRQLKVLESWSREVDNRYQRLWKEWGNRVENLGREVSSTAEPLRASAEEFIRWLRKSLEPLPQEFLPYCQRYARPKIDSIRKFLVAAGCQEELLPARIRARA
jgi:transposase-like protein